MFVFLECILKILVQARRLSTGTDIYIFFSYSYHVFVFFFLYISVLNDSNPFCGKLLFSSSPALGSCSARGSTRGFFHCLHWKEQNRQEARFVLWDSRLNLKENEETLGGTYCSGVMRLFPKPFREGCK